MIGRRVEFVATWSSFVGMLGTIVQVRPHLMVRLDDDPRPIRVGDREVLLIEEPQHIGGAE